MLKQVSLSAFVLAVVLSLAGWSNAAVFTGDVFYTRYHGTPNVKKVSVSYDDVASTFTLGTPVAIGSTSGADGIAGNPQNSDLLLVGGQWVRISTISKSTGTATSYGSPVSVYHLEVADPTTVYGSGIPGGLAKHGINPDGSLTTGTAITLSGDDTQITQLITTPSGFFYTRSGSGGFGNFGTLSFTSSTAATTTRVATGLAAAHGGVYDPFTETIILMGDDHISQFNLAGTLVSDRNFFGFGGVNPQFDQGTVDGRGHLFAASNTGHLMFVDYSASSLVGDLGNFAVFPFLDSYLDDVAPLVGAGSTPVIPEPTSFAVWSLLVLSLTSTAWWRRRKEHGRSGLSMSHGCHG